MFDFQSKLRERLKKTKTNTMFLGALCVSVINGFFDKRANFSGKLKNGIFFVKVEPVFFKTEVFLHKQKILNNINQKIEKLGFSEKIKDLIVK